MSDADKSASMVSFETLTALAACVRSMRHDTVGLIESLATNGILPERRATLALNHIDLAYIVVLQGISDASPAELV